MEKRTILKGITWDHSRGYNPMVTTSQRFRELHPDVEIIWYKRTLQEFADQSLQELAKEYDLLVIDHPWVGFAATQQTLVPLDQYLNIGFIKSLEENSVGQSFNSYCYDSHFWATPIDAATPVAACRPDLLKASGTRLPKNFKQLLALASTGRVLVPAIAIDALMHFYMFCVSLGTMPFMNEKEVIPEPVGIKALKLLKRLMDEVDPECFDLNPVKVYERMSQLDDYVYCPFGYGYANYSLEGYGKKRLHFHDLIYLNQNNKLISTLGGTGLAISSASAHIDVAVKYLEYVSSAACQQTLYFYSGGQPAHYQAWNNVIINFQSAGFFSSTLPALERAYLRPRYNGYLYFQDHAGEVVSTYLKEGGTERLVFKKLNQLYNYSLK